MLTVIIPTRNAAHCLPATLASLVPGAVQGLIKDVVIADGGSSDATCEIAGDTGAEIVRSPSGRGTQMAAGAEAARGSWLLFLHADTVLQEGWVQEAQSFIAAEERRAIESHNRLRHRAASFAFALDDHGFAPRCLERLVALRCMLLRLPYGDQGLLIAREHYCEVGGFRDMPLMEDVELLSRLGWGRMIMLRTPAVTSPARFHRDGYVARSLRNVSCLALFYLRVPPRMLAKLYG